MRPKRGVCSRNPKGGALTVSETLVKTTGQRSEWGPQFRMPTSKAQRLEHLGMFEENMEERQDECGTECDAGGDQIPWEFASLGKECDAPHPHPQVKSATK